MPALYGLTRNTLRHNSPTQLHHAPGNGNARSRLDGANVTSQDSNGSVAYVAGTTVCCGIHPAGQPTNYCCAPLRKGLSQFERHTLGLDRAFAGSYDGYMARGIFRFEGHTSSKNHQWRVWQLSPHLWVILSIPAHCPTSPCPFGVQHLQSFPQPMVGVREERDGTLQ